MIVVTCIKYRDESTPFRILSWEGEYETKRIRIFAVNDEKDKKLCGPALLNEIIVKDGNVYGLPRTEKFNGYFTNCVTTYIRYIDAFAQLAGAEVEDKIRESDGFEIGIKMVKRLSDINLKIVETAHRYITDNNKKIDVRGPMFITVVVSSERQKI